MQSPQAKLNQIRRILALWPPQAGDDGDELVRGYLLAVEDYIAADVENAVNTLIKGIAPGVNPSFRPKPSEVGAECRRQMNLRLDTERRAGLSRPRLPKPDIPRTAESRARVKAMIDECVANISANSLDPNPESEEGRKSIFQRTNERFDRERGFTVGDPEGQSDAA